MLYLPNIIIRTIRINRKMMTAEEFATNYHDLQSKRGIFSLIIRVKYMSLKKYIYTEIVNKENKCTTKTNVLSLCLGSPWVSNLLGLRDGDV